MSTEQHQTQILYEIALVIGNGNCLEDAALNSLSIYLKKLNCFAGAIFQSEKIKDKCWYKPIIS
ncbi:MAG: hypothetical protein JXR34_03770, partial [Bacteroidales bacterium]|nr:hypothetical protein [Bacteroidales bacterium]